MENTKKLICEIVKKGIESNGKISIGDDGIRYYFKRVELKYSSSSKWLVDLFEKSAIENGKKNSKSFEFDSRFSFYYDRPKYNGQKNGKIWFTELIELK